MTKLSELRSRWNRISSLFSEYERLNALKRAIERDREKAKRKDADQYYNNIVKRMNFIEEKLSIYLPEVEK